ncbi:histone acetyltransferase 1 [Maublancomyces gigas]|uniref:Histone acetyltransferase type B catalytic subunit n=1 Tax=Discina gigas TaxID=1032678 RepID=A0ABR3GMI3_9PEZI
MEPIDEWSVDANEALTLSLHSPTSGKQLTTFHPKYTYPIFGESETIFGYRNLNVRLAFAADNMAMCVDVNWTEQKKPVGEVVAENITETLKEYLPAEAFEKDLEGFEASLPNRKTNKPFAPPGTFLTSSQIGSKTYEIWTTTVDDPACKVLLANIQILVLLYIEGGSYIELDDEEWSNKRWKIFFLYEKSEHAGYSFIGYSTVYSYYYFSSTLKDLSRARISQFLILPPYQRHGHGSRFYDALIKHYLASETTLEITVEDPSESFSDLRDLRDLHRLETSGVFNKLTLQSVAAHTFQHEDIRKAAKMPQRQFNRCLEMALLKGLLEREKKEKRKQADRKRDKQWKIYRLVVKGRVYKQNRDVLAQLDRLERIDKLEETYFHVEDDYKRLLDIARHGRIEEDESSANGKKAGRSKRNTDMEEDEEMEEMEMGVRPKKRVRI